MRDKYQQEVVPALKKEFGYTNVMAIPKVEKVVINMMVAVIAAIEKLQEALGS